MRVAGVRPIAPTQNSEAVTVSRPKLLAMVVLDSSEAVAKLRLTLPPFVYVVNCVILSAAKDLAWVWEQAWSPFVGRMLHFVQHDQWGLFRHKR